MSDCDIEGHNDNVQLLSNKKYPWLFIKLERDPQCAHVAEEMEHEAFIYKKLSSSRAAQGAVPSFRFSKHIGVAREGVDFDDIGIENIPLQLKLSAIESLQAVSAVGILHGDLALRNIVQSREDPDRAKIIDFGRAEVSTDSIALQYQVKSLKAMLGLD
jgi:RIO-like serine/threonine protein kinase